MQSINLREINLAAHSALVLTLLVTFTTGLIVGRHITAESRESMTINEATISGPYFPYQLDSPIRMLSLPEQLKEVSAISFIDETRLAMIQDEEGIIFLCSRIDGHLIDKISFAGNGDYEGLVILDNEAWVLRSDGDLYHVSDVYGASPYAKKIETFLKSKDDTEGLSYDAFGHQLLIGLKEPPKLDGKRQLHKRAVFSYELQSNFMSATPFLLLDMNEIMHVYDKQMYADRKSKFDAGRKSDFQPSDLAIHPITGHIYHIAARGQLLVVSDRSGQIYYVRELPKAIFRQPEGITFDTRGTMFISNEGVSSNGTLLEFRFQPKPAKIEANKAAANFPLI
jgi:uncharacterized protein YjiK